MGLPYGRLSVGSSADVCIFDPDKHWTVSDQTLISAGHNTPFMDWELPGRVTHTLFEGNIVFQNNS